MTFGAWFIPAAAVLVWLFVAGFYPRQAIWFVMLWIPVQGWVQLNLFSDSNATVLIYEFQIVVLYVVFAVKALRSSRKFGSPTVLLAALPFIVWAMLLLPYSLGQGGIVLTGIGLRTYLLPLPLTWLGYHAFRDHTDLERLGVLLSIEMAAIGVIAALQFASVVTSWGSVIEVPTGYSVAGAMRPPATFSTPGHLGMYVLAMVPLALGFLGLQTTWRSQLSYGVGLAGAVLALVVNSQRAAVVLLCTCLPLIVLLVQKASAVKVLGWSVLLSVIGAALGLVVVGDAFVGRVRSISDDANYALLIAPVERLEGALQEPIIGLGLGSASPGAGRLDIPQTSSAESFMAALVYEFGVPGLFFFYVYLAALAINGFRALRRCRHQDVELLAAAILIYQVMILLQSWTYDPLHYPPSRVLFWFWAGVLISLPRLARSRARPVIMPLPNATIVRRRRLSRAYVGSAAFEGNR